MRWTIRTTSWSGILAGLGAVLASAVPLHAQGAGTVASGRRVIGVVFDSVAMRPLARAVVQAVQVTNPSQARTAVADAFGRFVLSPLPPGSWALAAMHPRIDSLGLDQIRRAVEVTDAAAAEIVVAVPNAGRLTRLICGDPQMRGDTSGYLTGVVRSAAADRAPVAGSVRVEWLELTVTPRGFARTRETRTAEAGADGRYLVCDVPVNSLVHVSAARGNDTTGVVDLQMPIDGIQQRDLYVGASRTVRVPVDGAVDSIPPGLDSMDVRRGDGMLRGRLVSATGAPLAGARVLLRDAGIAVRSDASGLFTMANLPSGTWNLDVRAVGHEPLTRPVDVLSGESRTVSYTLSKLVPLDTMRIRASLPISLAARRLAEFEERRKAGFGRFLGPQELERQQPLFFNDVLMRFPALRFERTRYGYAVSMRSTGLGARCVPRLYIDNVIVPNDGTADSYVTGDQVLAIEVYPGVFGPPQYMDFLSGCGAIVVWTGSRTTMNR
jgi:hypothetical protein